MNVFIAIHATALFVWGLPDNKFSPHVLAPLRSYIKFTGLWHTWNMFGGDVCSIQEDLRAQVQYRDGSQREWIAPRMQEMPLWTRVPKERFRKWRELNFHDDSAGAWAAAARFIARHMNTNPTNPPVHVALKRFWAPTPSIIPGQDYQPVPRSYSYSQSYTYYQCPIAPKDLQ